MSRAGPSGKKEMNKHLLHDLLPLDSGKKENKHSIYHAHQIIHFLKKCIILNHPLGPFWLAENHSKQTWPIRKFNKIMGHSLRF